MMKFKPTTLFELAIVDRDHADASVRVTGICSDSRYVQQGDLFVARDGVNHRGIDFVAQAAKAGAVAAIIECPDSKSGALSSVSIPVFHVDDLVNKAGFLASKMLDNPSHKMTVIGITGTNGKTSCAHYIAQALTALGKKTALIGTVGNGFPDSLETATHTTPDSIRLQQLLAGFYEQGADAVVMEVSSHALDQGRVAGVQFDAAALTNLSRDHLDYHGSMQAYADAKSRLFLGSAATGVPVRIALNADDDFGCKLAKQLQQANQPFFRYSVNPSVSVDVSVKRSVLNAQGVTLDIVLPSGDIHFDAAVVGGFNISNLLLVVSVLAQLDFTNEEIETAMAQVSAVPGRMECLVKAGFPAAIIDYAHTPDALEKALQAARKHCEQKLWIVFGCGGDRDTGKRVEMAIIAEKFADKVIVTSDNPRTEAADEIIEMIMQGFSCLENVIQISTREDAITMALQSAGPDDLVLVAGKGHEDYQEIMGVKYPFSDKQVVEDLMGGLANDA
ncbi:UDP-N-acetylmuramoyl-L-alanyl-D-glutamate--2,6-diaminopimelate ligase [Neptunomonas japonica]|uniref:UDP-N-acetylmuramoyl-L-alanyl-D-glutamate--2, 6-diaminopimelate ligase n=1 Tax=Neptunomonas japonica TaxID=417574 RepID=UPI000410229B|nr:UDP-N-acetylmuramoyl-L-alanyl-D-glutamate--2,6-diaminopimelate ligase [Neptunomonas japonica]